MTTLNTYTVFYQVTILEEGMTRKQYDDYGVDTCPTDMDTEEFQSSSDTKAMQYAEKKYNGFKTINGERVFLFLETLFKGDWREDKVVEQYL
tara:strand:- start:1295 stop:1570 length:276 start_codon:yes stop_codon:yes gene_type:complete